MEGTPGTQCVPGVPLMFLRDAGEVEAIQPRLGGLAHLPQALLVEGGVQPGVLQQVGEGAAAALAGVGHVLLPGRLLVLLQQRP